MNQKQLANVLVKILGLYFAVDGIVRIFNGVITIFMEVINRGLPGFYYWTSLLSGMLVGVIGFLLIVLSSVIADLMFRDE
ncbi:MAG TPA: hypothetical protein VGN23_00210 [Verrucomicrobiae bacterium]|jgi:hypothetical protein